MEATPDFTTMTEEEIAQLIKPHKFADFDEVLAWLHQQNPNMENNHPEDTDWQALKAWGRRY